MDFRDTPEEAAFRKEVRDWLDLNLDRTQIQTQLSVGPPEERIDNLRAWQGKLSDHMVDMTLPKFKITAEFLLKDALSALGMPLAFDPRKADFSGMTTREKLYISHVVHKAFVDVNEKGTEAAAATAVVMNLTSAPAPVPPATFRADRPFVFLLRDNRTSSILFAGRVVDPS